MLNPQAKTHMVTLTPPLRAILTPRTRITIRMRLQSPLRPRSSCTLIRRMPKESTATLMREGCTIMGTTLMTNTPIRMTAILRMTNMATNTDTRTRTTMQRTMATRMITATRTTMLIPMIPVTRKTTAAHRITVIHTTRTRTPAKRTLSKGLQCHPLLLGDGLVPASGNSPALLFRYPTPTGV
jgi:hypothetical protein